jgi:hypothetical protein
VASSTKPCRKSLSHDRACRWEPNSYGYLGEDGKKWHNFEGYEYGSPHQSGDVIGAGIHLERQEIFFT